MPLPSTGSISLGQVNTELGRSATASINMNDSAVRTLAQVGGANTVISMQDLRGKSAAILLAFNSGIDFVNNSVTQDGNTARGIIQFNSTGTITQTTSGYSQGTFFDGPSAWLSPTGGNAANLYRIRLIISSYFTYGNTPRFAFNIGGAAQAFVSAVVPQTTPYITMPLNNWIELRMTEFDYRAQQVSGTIEIQHISTLTTISRGFSMSSDSNF